jgi:hypothetical protein
MTTVNLDETLLTYFKAIATQQHTPVEQVISEAL